MPIRIDDTAADKAEALKELTTSGAVQKRRIGGRGRLLASTYQGKGQGFTLGRLYLEETGKDQDKETPKPILEAAAHHPALAALLNAAIGQDGAALTGAQMEKLNKWLTGIDAHIVRSADIEEAVKHIIK